MRVAASRHCLPALRSKGRRDHVLTKERSGGARDGGVEVIVAIDGNDTVIVAVHVDDHGHDEDERPDTAALPGSW